jgi:hypothetical protein
MISLEKLLKWISRGMRQFETDTINTLKKEEKTANVDVRTIVEDIKARGLTVETSVGFF